MISKQNLKEVIMTKKITSVVAMSAIAILGMSGCTKQPVSVSTNEDVSAKIAHLERQISQKDAEISSLKGAKSTELSLVPPNAKPGQCYSKVMVPAKYEVKTVRRLAKQPGVDVKIIPATYKTIDKVVTISEASTKLVTIPATYKMVQERVEVRPATTKLIAVEPTYKYVQERVMVVPEKESLVNIPAKYKTITEKILVKKAHTVWKKGRGSVEKVNNSTGDIMCLVEVPAVYKTITKKVIDTPASVKRVVTPAVYKTITKKVIDTPATTREVTIPAVYKTITKKVIDTPASTREIAIPARTSVVKTKVLDRPAQTIKRQIPAIYKDVKVKVKVAEPHLRWQEILCETNTTPNVVIKLQRALSHKGYNITKFDGVYGDETRRAVRAYQRDMGMSQGALTLRTLKSLNIM